MRVGSYQIGVTVCESCQSNSQYPNPVNFCLTHSLNVFQIRQQVGKRGLLVPLWWSEMQMEQQVSQWYLGKSTMDHAEQDRMPLVLQLSYCTCSLKLPILICNSTQMRVVCCCAFFSQSGSWHPITKHHEFALNLCFEIN